MDQILLVKQVVYAACFAFVLHYKNVGENLDRKTIQDQTIIFVSLNTIGSRFIPIIQSTGLSQTQILHGPLRTL